MAGKTITLPSITETIAARKAATDPLNGIQFASDPARRAAKKARMVASHFSGIAPTGANGYTVDDVRRIARA